jgi:predicted phage terminase large subunit-like protein
VIGRRPRLLQSLPQDPGQAGKVVRSGDIAALLEGYDFKITPETGDKETRAEPYRGPVERRRVFLVRGEWNNDYIEELRNFPAGSYKDQVDASSRAYMASWSASAGTTTGVAGPRIPG